MRSRTPSLPFPSRQRYLPRFHFLAARDYEQRLAAELGYSNAGNALAVVKHVDERAIVGNDGDPAVGPGEHPIAGGGAEQVARGNGLELILIRARGQRKAPGFFQ